MNHLLYGIKYITEYWLSSHPSPLICGLVLTNKCNLKCIQCRVTERETSRMTYQEAVRVIDHFYDKGGRCLYFEGGEPFIWKDHQYRLNDLADYAKQKGYYTTVVYTNGTQPIESSVDTIFVSLDGLRKTNDRLRGETFDEVMMNIHQSSHPNIYINFTINNINKSEIGAFCEYMSEIPKVKGVFFYFHTPYYGFDDLYIPKKERDEITKNLIQLKKKFKILNSTSGLKAVIKNNWGKKSPIFQVYEKGQYYDCCRINEEGSVCKDCGYLSYAEVDQTLKLKPDAIFNALKYF